MTLMFGNLTLAFVRFGTAIQNALAPGSGSSPAAMQELNAAAGEFRDAAAKDALYLVCIGMFLLLSYHQGAPYPFCHRRVRSLSYVHDPPEHPLCLAPHGYHPCTLFSGVSGRLTRSGCRVLTHHFRHWVDRGHLYIHVNVDVHWRSQCEAHS